MIKIIELLISDNKQLLLMVLLTKEANLKNSVGKEILVSLWQLDLIKITKENGVIGIKEI